MSKGTGEGQQLLQQQPSSPSQSSARRWPFFAVLLSVVILGSSPWLYSRLMPKVPDYQRAGDHLHSTPWQMMYNPFGPNFTFERAVEILNCTNGGLIDPLPPPSNVAAPPKECPSYFHLIHKDLAPWKEKGVTRPNVNLASVPAEFKVTILGGKLYVDRYDGCFGLRAVFTVWGLLLFLKKFEGQVPDLEMAFNCEDRPRIPKADLNPDGPAALFAYNTNSDHYDIPFPDWSFWGWAELMISSWDEKREKIVEGSQQVAWKDKVPRARWGGNPWVGAPHRVELLKCHNDKMTEIMIHDWRAEIPLGKTNGKLEDQCTHRYMIYTEGNGWSVSLKYILACGSPTLLISPTYYDFFSRGLQQWVHYIPIRPAELRAPEMCQLLDKAVAFGEANHTQAMKIGKAAQDYMRNDTSMENVYSYMFHLLTEYASLQKFTPSIDGEAHLVTLDHVLCLMAPFDQNFLKQAMKVMPSDSTPCRMSDKPVDDAVDLDWEVHIPR